MDTSQTIESSKTKSTCRSDSNISAISSAHSRGGSSRVTFSGGCLAESLESSVAEDDFVKLEEGRISRRSLFEKSSSSFNVSQHLRMSRRNLNVDEDILHRAAADAGLGSMGTVYVEVWTLDEEGTELVRPDGGYWMDPIFHSSQAEHGCCGSHQCNACRISDPDHPEFLPADPVPPGVGLAGVLWSESFTVEDTMSTSRRFSRSYDPRTPAIKSGWFSRSYDPRRHRRSIFKDSSNKRETKAAGTGGNGSLKNNKRRVVWRDIQAMVKNPDLPYDERLCAIAASGLGWAAGVPFHVNGHKGIMIYVARKSVDLDLLHESGNENYLLCAADLIGSAWALREPRKQAMESRKAKRDAALRRAKLKIITLIRLGVKFDHTPQNVKNNDCSTEEYLPTKILCEEEDSANRSQLDIIIKNTTTRATQFAKVVAIVAKKCKGSKNKPPPPFTNEQAFFSFVGSFILLTLLSGISHSLVTNHGHELLLLMPPFGAFVCLQFGLTQAPAAQPRNCLVGQFLSGCIGLTVSMAPFVPVWFKQALGTSLVIGIMARCGAIHPPAGASAFVFSSGLIGVSQFGLLMMGNLFAIVLGSVINNTSDKRQYPTYYAMGLNPKDMINYLNR